MGLMSNTALINKMYGVDNRIDQDRLLRDFDIIPEVDFVSFRFENLFSFICRRETETYCGYVGVPLGHPLHGINHDALNPAPDNNTWDDYAHGGLTYSGYIVEADTYDSDTSPALSPYNQFISDSQQQGNMPEDVWWFGFDCNHYRDLSPYMVRVVCQGGRISPREYATCYGLQYVDLNTVYSAMMAMMLDIQEAIP